MNTKQTAIALERPDTADGRPLIGELEAEFSAYYPATSRYGYTAQKLIDQGVALFVTRYDSAPAGSGGIQIRSTAS
jgi:hypothetical protein